MTLMSHAQNRPLCFATSRLHWFYRDTFCVPVVMHHVFRGDRLQAFSDAVFAIVATIMVIPLKLEEDEIHENFVLRQYLYNLYPRYLVYLFSFILVVDTWYSHARIFSIVEQVDDVLIWLNLLSLLFISFLPYGIGLISHFQDSRPEGFEIAVSTCSAVIILTGITMVVMVLYAFRKQALLHPEIAGNSDIRSVKIGLLITLSVNPLLALMAQLFQFKETQHVSLVFFYSMGVSSFFVRTLVYMYHHRKQHLLPDFAVNMFRTVASKSRTEAFSDGLFSIVATLILLDFTSEIPSSDDVRHTHGGNLRKALAFKKYSYLAYVASFCIVGLLWFVQYGMFHFLKNITPMLSFVNTLTLSLICGIPFISSIYTAFADEVSTESEYYTVENELVAIQASVVLIFLVGVSQLIFWTIALNSKAECLDEEVEHYPAEPLMFVKIIIFPTVSAIMFCLTFTEQVSVRHVYGSVVTTTPFLFLLAKAAFSICQPHPRIASMLQRLVHRNGNKQGQPALTKYTCKPNNTPSSINTDLSEQVPLMTNS